MVDLRFCLSSKPKVHQFLSKDLTGQEEEKLPTRLKTRFEFLYR